MDAYPKTSNESVLVVIATPHPSGSPATVGTTPVWAIQSGLVSQESCHNFLYLLWLWLMSMFEIPSNNQFLQAWWTESALSAYC